MDSEKEIYQLLFDNAGEGMLVTNKKGVIELMNPRLLKMFGYKREELLGQPVEVLVPDAIRSRHQSHRENYVHHPKNRRMGGDMDLLARRKDGSEFSVEIGLNHCNINDELKVVVIVTDITERVNSQNKFKKPKSRIRKQGELKNIGIRKKPEVI